MRTKASNITREWLLNLFAKGHDTLHIAKMLGVDESVVYNCLSK